MLWLISGIVGFGIGAFVVGLLTRRRPEMRALPWAPPQHEVMRGLSHEIRNPLNTMSVTLQLLDEDLEEGVLDPEDLKTQLARIHREVGRLEQILADFQRYARMRMRAEAVNVSHLLDDTLGFMSPEAETRSIRVERCIEPTPIIAADPSLLRQAFLNVIVNAFQAMDGGGTLNVALTRDGNAIRVSFEDDGEGISEEAQGRVFEPFFSTKSGGTGLGMSVVRQVAEMHGGSVDVRSRPNEGTRVTFDLPMRVVSETEA